MTKRLVLAFSVLCLLTFPNGCQTYTQGLQQSLARADETAALTTLKAIALAQRTYSITNNGEFGTLKQLVDGGFIDARFGVEKPVKDYVITVTVTPKASGAPEGSYTVTADPEKSGDRAGRHLYMDNTSASIHFNETQTATAADPVMQ